MEKYKIMAVDDNEEFLAELVEMLTGRGYDVLPVLKAEVVVKTAVKGKPDLILLDIKLKGSSGLNVLEDLKNNPATSKIPVIAMTGVYGGLKEIIEAYGVKEFLVKPFDPSLLFSKIESIFEKKKLYVEIKKIKKIEENLKISGVVFDPTK